MFQVRLLEVSDLGFKHQIFELLVFTSAGDHGKLPENTCI